MRFQFQLLLIGGSIAVLGSIAACKSEYIETAPVCFERDVKPIIVANCTQSGCHNSVDREKGRDYTSYNGVLEDIRPGNYLGSELYSVLVKTGGDEAMPPKPYSRLSEDQIRIIATWIEEGATNDTCATNTTCDTTGTMSYTNHVKPLLNTYCNVCHGGNASAGGSIQLGAYASVKLSVDNGTLLGSIEHADGYSAMPKGGNKMADCDIAFIKKWINSGAPNN